MIAQQIQQIPRIQVPVNRQTILLGVSLVASALVGLLASTVVGGVSPQHVQAVDYVAVVAQIYAHDNDLSAAQQRLGVLGVPARVAASANDRAAGVATISRNDRFAIASLAQALNNPAAAAGAAPQATGADAAPSKSGSGVGLWLGPVLTFLLFLVLGGIVLFRTAGLSFPRFGGLHADPFGRAAEPRRPLRPRPPSVSPPVLSTPRPPTLPLDNGEPAAEFTILAGDAVEPEPERGSVRLSPLSTPMASFGSALKRATATLDRAPSRAAPTTGPRPMSFNPSYHLGDDPYDEIHPILDRESGTLIGACGFSAALKLQRVGTSHYFGFAAWVQDYLSGEPVRTVGIVSPWGMQHERQQVDEWMEKGMLDQVVQLRKGAGATIQTQNVEAQVVIGEFQYGDDGSPSESCLDELAVRFDVKVRTGLG